MSLRFPQQEFEWYKLWLGVRQRMVESQIMRDPWYDRREHPFTMLSHNVLCCRPRTICQIDRNLFVNWCKLVWVGMSDNDSCDKTMGKLRVVWLVVNMGIMIFCIANLPVCWGWIYTSIQHIHETNWSWLMNLINISTSSLIWIYLKASGWALIKKESCLFDNFFMFCLDPEVALHQFGAFLNPWTSSYDCSRNLGLINITY